MVLLLLRVHSPVFPIVMHYYYTIIRLRSLFPTLMPGEFADGYASSSVIGMPLLIRCIVVVDISHSVLLLISVRAYSIVFALLLLVFSGRHVCILCRWIWWRFTPLTRRRWLDSPHTTVHSLRWTVVVEDNSSPTYRVWHYYYLPFGDIVSDNDPYVTCLPACISCLSLIMCHVQTWHLSHLVNNNMLLFPAFYLCPSLLSLLHCLVFKIPAHLQGIQFDSGIPTGVSLPQAFPAVSSYSRPVWCVVPFILH